MKHITSPGPIETISHAAMVDELAELKAMIAPLQAREEQLKNVLKATGKDRIDGTEHTAVISLSEREMIDGKRLRADLGEELVAPYLSRSLVTVLKLTARRTH